jgi:hypothetical protein
LSERVSKPAPFSPLKTVPALGRPAMICSMSPPVSSTLVMLPSAFWRKMEKPRPPKP